MIGAGLAFAGSQGGHKVSGFSIYALCIALAFLIQWIAFIPSYLNRTEKFYDLSGGITYITVTLMAMLLTPDVDARSLLLAGIGYFIFRMVKKRREAAETGTSNYNQTSYGQGGYQQPVQAASQGQEPEPADVAAGLAHIRQMDSSFDENRFNDGVMDIFFKIQGSWMNRDLSPVSGLLTDEMRRIFQEDLDRLLRDRQVNRLENIAVRNVEIVEAWQESGQDFITALIYANLLDYTTDDTSGAVVSGSKTEPVKFEEYWTFTRPVGNNPWRLSAINQK